MWWLWALGYIVIGIVVTGVAEALFIAAGVKRLKDTDKTLEWLLIFVMVLIWPFVLLLMVMCAFFILLVKATAWVAGLSEKIIEKLRSGGKSE